MLVEEERKEAERILKLYQRQILNGTEVIHRLGSVARPHNFTALLAELPAELIEPLRIQTLAYRPVGAIGYWLPVGYAPSRPTFRRPSDCSFPDPRLLVCSGSYPENQQAVVAYLRAGHRYAEWRGISYCRFGCGNEAVMGSRCLTDGQWVWPEGLPHYVETHSVLLPHEFTRQAASNGSPAPLNADFPRYETQGEPDYEFWIEWGKATRQFEEKQ